jgi:transcriptional regulator of acetoin/glycerol metabolism
MATVNMENIKNRIDELKNRKARAEGQKSSIEDSWKRDYNISTLEEAEELKASMEKELDDVQAEQEKYLAEADALLSEAGV